MTIKTPVEFQNEFDVIVVGGGHCGCESALLASKHSHTTRNTYQAKGLE